MVARSKKLSQPAKCLVCKQNKPQSRGACGPCGATVRAGIDRGEWTEQQAIDRGLILPRKKTGRPLGGKRRELIEQRLAKSGK